MNVATLQMDWSENPTLTQAGEERLAYYHNYHIGLHAVHLWSTDKNQSMSALSDYTDHKAAAVMASMKAILTDLIGKGEKLIYIVSNPTSSQYRNKKMFWLASKFLLEYEIELR